jgi:hypothetical protein
VGGKQGQLTRRRRQRRAGRGGGRGGGEGGGDAMGGGRRTFDAFLSSLAPPRIATLGSVGDVGEVDDTHNDDAGK